MPAGMSPVGQACAMQEHARCRPPRTAVDRLPRHGVPSYTRVAGTANTSGWPRGSPGAVCMHTDSRNTSVRKGGLTHSATGSTALRCRDATGAQGGGDRAACLFGWACVVRWVGSVASPLRQAAWSLLPREQSRRQPRHGLRSRTATTLIRHTHPSRNVSRRPSRPGRRLPCRPGTPRRPEMYHAPPVKHPRSRLPVTHTEIILCGAVVVGGGSDRAFVLTQWHTGSILTWYSC